MKSDKGNPGWLLILLGLVLLIGLIASNNNNANRNYYRVKTTANLRELYNYDNIIDWVPEGEQIEVKGQDPEHSSRVIVYWRGKEGTLWKKALENYGDEVSTPTKPKVTQAIKPQEGNKAPTSTKPTTQETNPKAPNPTEPSQGGSATPDEADDPS